MRRSLDGAPGGTLVGTATPAALLAAISDGPRESPSSSAGTTCCLTLDAGTMRDLQALGVGVLATARRSRITDSRSTRPACSSRMAACCVEAARHAMRR